MKRKPTSKIWHTIMYLHRVCGRTTFTARDIHDAMPAAQAHYHSLIPLSVLTERDRLLAAHNIHWLRNTAHIYDVHSAPDSTHDLPTLRQALRRLFKPYITIDEPYYSTNFTSSLTTQTFKCGYIELTATNPRTYRINPDYLED